MHKGSARPITIVDVGALGGVHRRWEGTDHRAVLFEPNPQAEFQKRGNWTVLDCALSDAPGERTLYLAKKRSNSSFLKPNFDLLYRFNNPGRYETVGEAKVKTDTLDHQARQSGIDDIDFIKLDVQGHELAVLRGSVETLAQAVAVELEVQFVPLYRGAPLFGEVDAFLRAQGFELRRFLHLEHWMCDGRERLVWGNALYVKNPLALSEHKRECLALIERIVRPDRARFSVRKFKRKAKQNLKRLLAWGKVIHPALGVKMDPAGKAGALLRLKSFGINTLVETGTNTGETICRIGDYFQKVYSIELDEALYAAARARFADKQNLTLLHGDSAVILREVLAQLGEPALFWLDAHGAGEITAQSAPVIEEVKAIFAYPVRGHIVVIDDARLFDRRTINTIRALSKQYRYDCTIEDGLFRLLPR